MKNNACPDCGKTLNNRNKCRCGWFEETKDEVVFDNRCHYQINGKRCCLPGTMSSLIQGRTISWYCFQHWQPRNDISYRDSFDSFDNEKAKKILETRSEWRHHLFPEELCIKKNYKPNQK